MAVAFLLFPGVGGPTSPDTRFPGYLELLSASIGIGVTDVAGVRLSAAERSFTLTRKTDGSSAAIVNAYGSGTGLGSVTLSLVVGDGRIADLVLSKANVLTYSTSFTPRANTSAEETFTIVGNSFSSADRSTGVKGGF